MEDQNNNLMEYQVIEQYRTLRTNIKLLNDEAKVIAVTSAKPEEGKTTVSVKLAESFSDIGEKILIIDGDLRKSKIKERYQVDNQGLTAYLSSSIEIQDAIGHLKDNIDIIPAGEPSMESTTLLDSDKFRTMIHQLRENYDRIIVDTPSFLGISDAIILIKECDGVLLVIEENKISNKTEQEVIEKLQAMGSNLLGVVLNKVTLKENLNPTIEYYTKR